MAKIKITRFEVQDQYIKGYVVIDDQECEVISLPIHKGLNDVRMIYLNEETLTDIIEMINYSLGEQ